MFKSFHNLWYNCLKSSKRVSTLVNSIKGLKNSSLNRLTITSTMSAINVKSDDQNKCLIKSTNDKFIYKYIVLSNGLKALLVSDPTFTQLADTSDDVNSDCTDSEVNSDSDLTEVSSCDEKEEPIDHKVIRRSKPKQTNDKISAIAVVVRTGSFADPKQVQGLAHLVEHVLTMGSEKFPEENGLDDYLTSRGGYQNAHTEYEYTSYEVEVHRKHMYGALQRLSHYFIHPLLKKESIEREIKPVDTEYTAALPDDEVRLEQIFNNLANEGHPFNAFMWGNALSLKTIPEKNGTDTQKHVKEFYERHYFSDNIHVVIQSQESIETLEEWVTELFTQIRPLNKNNEIENSEPIEPKFGKPFDNNQNFNKLYFVEPVSETDQLFIFWCLPPITQHFKTNPLDYLGNIVGHEGKGSLISRLRKENLALELIGGIEDSGFANNKYSSVFTIAIKLTDLGNKCVDRVVEYVFEYLNVLQSVGPQEWFFNELKNIEKNRFNWQEEQSALNYVKKLANNLRIFPIEYVLCGSKLYLNFDEELIRNYLKLLTPENACFVRLCTNILNDEKDIQTEQWFGTRYAIKEVPKNWLSLSLDPNIPSKRFHFPNPNPYIATDFEIKKNNFENEVLFPTKVLDKNRVKLWYKSDNKFKLPKAIIKLHIISPLFSDSVESAVMADLFVEILLQNLSEEVYDATLAGLYWTVSQTNTGLVVTVSGFDHKLNILLETLLNKMIGFEVEDKVFNDVKKNLSKGYHNSFIDPMNLNKSLRLTILSHKYFNFVDRRDVLNSIDKQRLKTFVTKFFSDFYIEALIQGNVSQEKAMDLLNEIESKLRLDSQKQSIEEPKLMTAQIPVGEGCCRVISLSAENKNSSITNYYQLIPANIRLQCMLSVLSSVMDEPCFDILRTKEGLGYYVAAMDYDTYGISGFGVSVNSSGNEFDCSFVDQRIENFIKQMIDIISDMNIEKFKEHIVSLITAKKVPDLQLREEFTRNWNEIISFNYCFNRLEKEIKCLEKITFDEFKEWSCNQILRNSSNKRKLSVQIVGYGNKSLLECLTFDGKALDLETNASHQQNNRTEDSEKCFKKFKLTYLKSKNCDNNCNQFIDDIIKYKTALNIFPVHKVID